MNYESGEEPKVGDLVKSQGTDHVYYHEVMSVRCNPIRGEVHLITRGLISQGLQECLPDCLQLVSRA